jgi:hypothetical protein
MILTVSGTNYELANYPPSWTVPLTESMIAELRKLNNEELANYADTDAGAPASSFVNWRKYLLDSGAVVAGSGERSESTLSRVGWITSGAILAGVLVLVVYLLK